MEHEKSSKSLQFFAAITGNLSTLAAAAAAAWIGPEILMLTENPVNPENPIGRPFSEEEMSWFGSIQLIGAALGSFIAGYLADRWGRRITLLASVVPMMLGWILIATSSIIELLYTSRFISGLALSISFTVAPMYCGEIAETSYRGTLGSFLQLFSTVGILYSYAIGPYVSYRVFWIADGILPLIFFAAFFTMPESPYYLLANGRRDEAINSLARLRGKCQSNSVIVNEANEIQAFVEESLHREGTLKDLFSTIVNVKALFFTCVLMVAQQMSGISVVLVYSEVIFASAGNNSIISSSLQTIIVGLVQVVASTVAPAIVDRLGRKILLVISATGTALSTITLGFFFYLKDSVKDDVSGIGWLPIVCLLIFIATYSVGLGPVPWAMMGEMFASKVKSKASGITVFVTWTLGFVNTKYFSIIAINYGNYTAFWIFGVFSILSVLFTLFVLPETKGKTLSEIQHDIAGVK